MSRVLGLVTNKLLQQAGDQGLKGLIRSYTECEKKPCPLGPTMLSCREPQPGYAPERLGTTAFKIPPFIPTKIFRIMKKNEQLGPNAGKCEIYRNPEYFSYHRYSYNDLKIATNAVKACEKCCK